MTLPHQGLVFLGCGGHARAVADVAMSLGYNRLWFVDAAARDGEMFWGQHPVCKTFPIASEISWGYVPASGDNVTRLQQIADLRDQNLPIVSIISSRATIGAGAKIGEGCFVGHHAHVGPLAQIGIGSIINTGAIVEHDCRIGDGAHISVGTIVAGQTSVGDQCFLGAGATIIDQLTIVDDVTLGAGSVVTSDIRLAGTYVGTPARRISA